MITFHLDRFYTIKHYFERISVYAYIDALYAVSDVEIAFSFKFNISFVIFNENSYTY